MFLRRDKKPPVSLFGDISFDVEGGDFQTGDAGTIIGLYFWGVTGDLYSFSSGVEFRF
jgi:hypothetical protein